MADIQTTMPVQPQGFMDGDGIGRNWGGPLVGGLVGFLAGTAIGGGGLFGNRNAGVDTVIGLTNEGLNLALQNNQNQIARETSNQLCNGFASVNSGICGINLGMCQGFGSLTHQIDLGNCKLETAIHAEGEATRALITDNRIRQLESENNALRLEANNFAQTNAIISAVKPCPVPAYGVCNPNTVTVAPPFNYGFGGYPFGGFGGCGCNPCC